MFESGADYLKYIEEAGKESDGAPPESLTARPAVDPETVARAINYYRQQHGTRQADLDKITAELVEDGISPARAERLVKVAKDKVNEQYADGLNFAGYEAANRARSEEQAALTESFRSTLGTDFKTFEEAVIAVGKADPQGIARYPDVLRAFQEVSRKGFVAKKDHDAAIVKAFNEGRAVGLKNQPTANGGRNNHTGTAASGSKNFTTVQEAQAAHRRGEISNAEMNAIKASGLSYS